MAERDITKPDYSKEGVSQAASLLKACLESNSREPGNASFQQRTDLLVKEGLLPELSIGRTGNQTGNVTTSGISFARIQESYLQAETEFRGCEDGGRAVLYGIKQRLGQPLEANENAYLYAVREFQGLNDGGRAVSYSTRERLGQALKPEEKAYLVGRERSMHPSSAYLPGTGEKSAVGDPNQGIPDCNDSRQSPIQQYPIQQSPFQQSKIDPDLSVQERNGQMPAQFNRLYRQNRDSERSQRTKPTVLEVPSLIL